MDKVTNGLNKLTCVYNESFSQNFISMTVSDQFFSYNCLSDKRSHRSIYLFGVLHHFQHSTGHITMGSFVGRRNQYIQLVKALYCKLATNGKQLPAFPLEVRLGTRTPISEVGGKTHRSKHGNNMNENTSGFNLIE